jgi:hypothetical protein
MKQSRAASLIEAFINIAVGFGLSIGLQAIVLPALGVPIPWGANLAFACVMTVVSIARQFVLRRVFEALHIRRPLSPFMVAVVEERRRQIDVEGWSAAHDDDHLFGEIAMAGGCYAIFHTGPIGEKCPQPSMWPWSRGWWKPQDFRRDIVRAAALIVAEGEKFDRNRKTVKWTREIVRAKEALREKVNEAKTSGLTEDQIRHLIAKGESSPHNPPRVSMQI